MFLAGLSCISSNCNKNWNKFSFNFAYNSTANILILGDTMVIYEHIVFTGDAGFPGVSGKHFHTYTNRHYFSKCLNTLKFPSVHQVLLVLLVIQDKKVQEDLKEVLVRCSWHSFAKHVHYIIYYIFSEPSKFTIFLFNNNSHSEICHVRKANYALAHYAFLPLDFCKIKGTVKNKRQ